MTAWLQRHRRFTFHFTPTSCSWANAVEGLFAKLTRHRLKRGVFTSIVELQAAISRFIAETNDMPKPFVWTKSADDILAAVQRGRQALVRSDLAGIDHLARRRPGREFPVAGGRALPNERFGFVAIR